MIHLVYKEFCRDDYLTHKLKGLAAWAHVEQRLRGVSPDTIVIADLAGIEFMSASFFTAAVLPLWQSENTINPILVNVNSAETLFSIEVVLRSERKALWIGHYEASRVFGLYIIGSLEDTARQTLQVVLKLKHASTVDLSKYDPKVRQTAWNNRLTPLYDQRLLRRVKDGRRFIYSPIWASPDEDIDNFEVLDG